MDTKEKWSEAHPVGSKVRILCCESHEWNVVSKAFFVPGQHCVLLEKGGNQLAVPLEAIKGTRELFLPNVKGDAAAVETLVQQGSYSPSHPPACSVSFVIYWMGERWRAFCKPLLLVYSHRSYPIRSMP